MSLKTDYKDDILAVGNLRKYQMIQNDDGTVSFQDVTQYEQTGDVFGAGDINKTNQAVNEKFDSGDVVDPMLTTEPGFAADAYQTKLQFDEQNKNLEWKYLGDCSPNTTFALPDDWKEIYAVAYQEKNNHTGGTKVDFFVPRFHVQTINGSYTNFCKGWYGNTDWYGYTSFRIDETQISAYSFNLKNVSQTNASLKIYYR